jgi:hypothetical protein
MQLAFLSNPEGDVAERRQAFALFFERFGAQLPDTDTARRHVEKALADELFWRASRIFDAGDAGAARRLLREARSIHPPVTATGKWQRMTLKRRLGPRLWGFVQRLARPEQRV